ncbi:unnamed protein product [Trichogramma brassicae]|uniref:Uncharacterized protein n=1 Tax=Trichogramma brassicae TaxID=86971 RepID=A0A6H5IE52_9HYME|nr:unnamed protein product [Trichogramma brassicae]
MLCQEVRGFMRGRRRKSEQVPFSRERRASINMFACLPYRTAVSRSTLKNRVRGSSSHAAHDATLKIDAEDACQRLSPVHIRCGRVSSSRNAIDEPAYARRVGND